MNDLDFYSAAAQVIPLLFIVFAFQLRYFDAPDVDLGRWWARIGRTFDFIVLASAVAGEWAALYALQSGHGTWLTSTLVEGALLSLGGGIVYLTWRGVPRLIRRVEALEQLNALHSALGTREGIDRIRADLRELRERADNGERDLDDRERDDDAERDD